MGGAVRLEPLFGVDLVRAQDGAHRVVEDLGGGTRQRAQARVLHPAQVGLERLAQAAGALGDLERREAVDVDVRHRRADGAADLVVVVTVERRVDAALETHLGGAGVPRLACAARDLIHRQ